ncbi:MFS transporter [Novosphingobium profundi]|uniref:MFS transporter n=1 Tax=Novosphingobium profundi TaxID=1774954 RepID=UPI001BDB073C|nr:MFS transporter [Novosphingobium profundi]MBT0667321.1 MFS transporter [Novosphingobium profundi]
MTRRQLWAIVAVGLSTIVEWYDFTLCLYFAPTLARIFFGTGQDALFDTLAGFAIAYLMRPVGAIMLGLFGDRFGRRPALLLSMAGMTIAMLGMAALPTYSQIGSLAGLGLIAMRCLMGLSVGGEYTAVVSYLYETAPPHRRGLVTSCAAAASELGGLLAATVCAWLAASLGASELASWGWRIPFVVGALLAGMIWLLRSTIGETPQFHLPTPGSEGAHPLRSVLRHHGGAVGTGFAISALGSITYYVGVTYIPSFLETVGHIGQPEALHLSSLAAVAIILVTPLIGWASDLLGRKPVLLALAFAATVLPVPLFSTIGRGPYELVPMSIFVLAVLAGGVSAVGAVATAEVFPSSVRLTGLGLGATLATAFFGGFAPVIAHTLQTRTGSAQMPGIMICATAVFAALWLLRIRLPRPLDDETSP